MNYYKKMDIESGLLKIYLSIFVFLFYFLKESEIQLGPGDCGDDSRVLLLGLHRDSDSRRVHILQTGCKQVTAPAENPRRQNPQHCPKENHQFRLSWNLDVIFFSTMPVCRMSIVWCEVRSVTLTADKLGIWLMPTRRASSC